MDEPSEMFQMGVLLLFSMVSQQMFDHKEHREAVCMCSLSLCCWVLLAVL